jgi:Transglycosylase SLT domain/D-alanyl-D-alanine carboxypeptidase/Putative Flp pilus-assembly TadE/G-like
MSRRGHEHGTARGQASILLVGGLAGVLVGALVLGAVTKALGREGEAQRAADLAALAGARAMREAYPRLFEPATVDGRANPLHLDRRGYLALGRAAARATARENGAGLGEVAFPDAASFAPVRIRVVVRGRIAVRRGQARRATAVRASATAELSPLGPGGLPAGGGYDGPLEHRQGKPMRPDVARAFDRMNRAAHADGVALLITSAYRSDAEQAVLWRRRPDPRWVARPGESLHRYATELDLGPPGAYGWRAAHAGEFHFLRRYPHEPWHFGYTLNARSAPRGAEVAGAATGASSGAGAPDGQGGRALPAFVPARFAPALARAAQRWNVSAALLAAQLYAESNFNPFATSPAGAQGIAQFMPETARAMGLADPFDAAAAIDAQARLMRDLLRRFAAVPLALAAYNAGPGPVAACGCVPPFPETRGYVARILGLLGGMGELGAGGLVVRLVD